MYEFEYIESLIEAMDPNRRVINTIHKLPHWGEGLVARGKVILRSNDNIVTLYHIVYSCF